jgi:hypothetical protein
MPFDHQVLPAPDSIAPDVDGAMSVETVPLHVGRNAGDE